MKEYKAKYESLSEKELDETLVRFGIFPKKRGTDWALIIVVVALLALIPVLI